MAVTYPSNGPTTDITTRTKNMSHGLAVQMLLLLANPINRVQVLTVAMRHSSATAVLRHDDQLIVFPVPAD